MKAFCDNDPVKFKSIKVRFVKHVFPGETLETRMWKEGSKVIFQVRVVERDEIAIANAAVEIASGGSGSAPSAGPSPSKGVQVEGFKASAIFAGVEASLTSEAARKQQIAKVGHVFMLTPLDQSSVPV